MARYDDRPVPRGTSHRWEVVLADDDEEDRPLGAERTALDVRTEHRVLGAFTDEQLGRIALLREGTALRRYRLYVDLHDPARADFAAEGTEVVKPGQRVVARDATEPALWTALVDACADALGRRRSRSA
jgi:hypothetical protein